VRIILLVVLSLFLVSCGSPLARDPIPTPTGIFLSFPPYLQPIAYRFAACAAQHPPLSLFLLSDPTAQTNLSMPLIQLQLGGSIPDGAKAYQIGEEEISFIVSSEVSTTHLTTQQILAIYSGEQIHWGFGEYLLIEVVSYEPGNALRSLLESSLPGQPRLPYRAMIAPDPQSMLREIAYSQYAIGYLPGSWLDNLDEVMQEMVKVLTLEPALTESLTQPVLAIVNEPLTPEILVLLDCLQKPED
jgi:hypothetical protein